MKGITLFLLGILLISGLACQSASVPTPTPPPTPTPTPITYEPKLSDIEILSYEHIEIHSDKCSSFPYPTRRAHVIHGTISNNTSYTFNYVEIQVDWCSGWDQKTKSCHIYDISYGYIYNLGPYKTREFTIPEDGYCLPMVFPWYCYWYVRVSDVQ